MSFMINRRHFVQAGAAGAGLIAGAADGAHETRLERETVVKNCLRGRGYQVYN